MRRTVLLLITSLLFLLPSCAPANDFQGGRPITKDDLSAISEELFTTTETTKDTEASKVSPAETTQVPNPETTAEQEIEDNQTNSEHLVYWLPGGSVYHLSLECSHIAGKENVNQTTVQEAEENGRRLCKTCEKKFQNS